MLQDLIALLEETLTARLIAIAALVVTAFGVGIRFQQWREERKQRNDAQKPTVRVGMSREPQFGWRHVVFDLDNRTGRDLVLQSIYLRRPRGRLGRFMGHDKPPIGSARTADVDIELPSNQHRGYELLAQVHGTPEADANTELEFLLRFHTKDDRPSSISVRARVRVPI
jgi:hypothetical protein